MWRWTLEFHKIRGISRVAEDMLASQEGLCSTELVKSKVTPVHAMKAYGRVKVTATLILNLHTRWKWSASWPGHFNPKERAPYYPLNTLREPNSHSGFFGEEKNHFPCQELKCDSYTEWAILADVNSISTVFSVTSTNIQTGLKTFFLFPILGLIFAACYGQCLHAFW